MLQKTFIFLTLAVLLFPVATEAKYRGEVGGWIPYWTEDTEVKRLVRQMDEVDIIYPFIYEIEGGEIIEQVDIDDGVWERLLDEADDERVEIIPTIAWFDGAAIHKTLSDRRDRQQLVEDIADLVDDNKRFDGINIDFEQKKAETIDYFSTFLKELSRELGRDELTCTIEARTPPEDLWLLGKMPEKINYANDYDAFNRYCDWVEIMAYDQQRADLTLNKERRGVPYAPVADIDWVEKVVEFALEDIDEDKIMLGVPTYGRAWDVTVAPEWYRDYDRVAALNYDRIVELSEDVYDVPIGRSDGGEGVITYFPQDSVYSVFDQLPTPKGTRPGYEAAAKALLVANYTGLEIPVRMVMFGDAEATEHKIELAEEHDLRGIAFWSWNGKEDEDIWDLF